MEEYPSIRTLIDLKERYQIRVKVVEGSFLTEANNYPEIELMIGEETFNMYLDDEYQDLKVGNPLLDICLIYIELEDYEYHEDITTWCQGRGIEPTDKVINYYRNLAELYRNIETRIGKIECPVSDYDIELNAGAAQALREHRTGPTMV